MRDARYRRKTVTGDQLSVTKSIEDRKLHRAEGKEHRVKKDAGF